MNAYVADFVRIYKSAPHPPPQAGALVAFSRLRMRYNLLVLILYSFIMLHQLQLAEEIGAMEVGSLQRYGRPAQEVSLVAVVATLIEVGAQRLGSLIQTEHLKGNDLG